MMISYDSFVDRRPDGALTINSPVTWQVHGDATAVTLILHADGDPDAQHLAMEKVEGGWSLTHTLTRIGLWFYHFEVVLDDQTWLLEASQMGLGGPSMQTPLDHAPNDYQLTLVGQQETVPDWYKDARFYHIFVDRFFNGNADGRVTAPKPNSFLYAQLTDLPFYIRDVNQDIARWDFYGGNLNGVTAKLDMLAELGVNALYLSPIFEAASNHRYDTGDYLKIDAMLGGLPAFAELLEEAHKRGMHVILDGVFNHVGRDSRYFNGAGHYPSIGAIDTPASPYYDWFNFTHYPNDYASWWGVRDLPAINKDNQNFQHFIVGSPDAVVNRWTQMGVDGWRLDVADELSDDFMYQIRHTLDEFGNKVLIGEVWDDASNKIAYDHRRPYFLGGMLQAVMNYPQRQLIIDWVNQDISSQDFIQRLLTLRANYPTASFDFNFTSLSTHDTERILTALDEDEARLAQAVTLLYTLPGIPVLYYGDEAGLLGGTDPDNRRYYPWGHENRTTLALYRKALAQRRDWPALAGDAAFAPFTFGAGLGYLRQADEQIVTVLLNPTDEPLEYAAGEIDGPYLTNAQFNRLPGAQTVAPHGIVVVPN